jgi:hypothetical protein
MGSQVAVARFRLLLGRACPKMRLGQEAAENFLAAARVISESDLVMEEISARSMLAACAAATGDRADALVVSGVR